MNMTYLHHSGFQIETKHSVLLFDYYTQNGMFDRVNEGDFPHKKFYIFVSHGHGDHYDPAILRWADRAHYILSDDVELPKDFKGEVTWVKPHQKLTVDDLEIETLASNDQGVAFVVKVAGKRTVFHAGDLNWWHWNGESEEFNKHFEINCASEHDAFYILTPQMMERIERVHDLAEYDLYINFNKDHLYIGVNNHNNSFELGMFEVNAVAIQSEFEDDLKYLLSIIDELMAGFE